MSEKVLTDERIRRFRAWLVRDEKSENTIAKYVFDVEAFRAFAEGRGRGRTAPDGTTDAPPRGITKADVVAYKEALIERGYASRSINSMLASLASFFRFAGWKGMEVRGLRVQRRAFYPEERELSEREYKRLVEAAERRGETRLALILQTIAGTGIRVSELRYITAEAVRCGETTVRLKGKTRTIFLVRKLKMKLARYMKEQGIEDGPLFLARDGSPLGRSTVWREMKRIAETAHVAATKVFPHALRHLFARLFYSIEKDIAKLADILGHSSIETTRIYIMTSGTEHKKRMERLRLIL